MRPVHTVAPRLAFFVAAGVLACLSSQVVAFADDDSMAACIAASDKALDLKKQGKLLEARTQLAACAAQTCGPDISPVCQKRLGEVGAMLPSIVFLPKDGSGHDLVGVKMTVDGARTEILDGRPVTLDPGAHAFRFEATGLPVVERTYVLAEGAQGRQERVDMGAPPAGTSLALARPSPDRPGESGGGSGRKTAGLVVGGVGVLGVTAGLVLGLMAISEWSSSQSDCRSTPTCSPTMRPQAVREHDTAATEATGSTIAFAVGGAALVAGAYLFFTAPSSSSTTGRSTAPVRVEPSVSPAYAGLSLHGAFQ